MNDERVWIAFMAAIKHEHREYMLNVLQEYDIGYYIVSFETSTSSHAETDGQHMHFVVQMKEKDYHTLTIRVFKKKFGLRGRAFEGKPRQYGKVKEIENLDKMKAYTLKEGDYVTNLADAEVEKLYAMSKSKQEEEEQEDALMEHLSKIELRTILIASPCRDHDMDINYTRLCKGVIDFYIEYNKSRKGLTRNGIEGIARKYIMYHYDGCKERKKQWIYNILFVR
uniref:hypothetical protein n=2 Tax=Pseudomonadati TaxID=3379134 RepID=UPI004048A5D7